MILKIIKWQLDDASAARLVTEGRINTFGNYEEEWHLLGLVLCVEYQGETDGGRWFGAVTGHKLGGFIGVSFDPDEKNYHLGTPAGAKSEKLIAAMSAAMKAEKTASSLSAEEVAKVFRIRNLFAAQKRQGEKEDSHV